jgi:hypothetical protein
VIRRFFAAAGGRWAPFVFAVSLVAIVAAGVWYTGYVQRQADERHNQIVRESEQKWCELLAIITGGPTPPPGPAGERARVISAALAQLRVDFGC